MLTLFSFTSFDTIAADLGAGLGTGLGATLGFDANVGLDSTLFPGYSIDYIKGQKVILFTNAHISKGTQFINYDVHVA